MVVSTRGGVDIAGVAECAVVAVADVFVASTRCDDGVAAGDDDCGAVVAPDALSASTRCDADVAAGVAEG